MGTVKKFSFSGLERYLKCSYKYFLWRFKKDEIPRPIEASVSMEAGTMLHTAVEHFLNQPKPRVKKIHEYMEEGWIELLCELDMLDALADLESIAKDVAHLDVRASKAYKGLDAIRDPDGKPYTKPRQTGAWAKAEAALELGKRRTAIDRQAAEAAANDKKLKAWTHVSLSETFSKTSSFCESFVDTLGNMRLEVLVQELPLSSPKEKNDFKSDPINLVYFPNGDMYTGYVDCIARDTQGRLYIIDHKTSKDAPESEKVMVWEQLILYSWAHHQLYGRYPDYIGINSIQHGELIIAKFNSNLVEGAVNRAMQAIKGIDSEIFIQQSPAAYNSPCYNKFNKADPICGYLYHCHPQFYNAVKGRL